MKTIKTLIKDEYPYPWHIEQDSRHGVKDAWQVWDSSGHIVAETTGYDADNDNERMLAALMAAAPELYMLIEFLDGNGALPEKTAMGFHAQKMFDEICAKIK